MTASVEIGFADLLDVLSSVFSIPADGRKALTSRLKHLQGKSFPRGVNVGRGGRVRYDLEAVMGTVLVLTLTSAFIPPRQAVEVVRIKVAGPAARRRPIESSRQGDYAHPRRDTGGDE